jgi:hypothetical protein
MRAASPESGYASGLGVGHTSNPLRVPAPGRAGTARPLQAYHLYGQKHAESDKEHCHCQLALGRMPHKLSL